MAGMFPQAGIEAPNTIGADPDVSTTGGCDALFHRASCVPRFDPVAANFMLSEILEAINLVQPYDCTRMDNLKTAIQNLTNLCGLPVIADADLNDSIAGCFNGANGQISINLLRELLGTCGLPVSNTPDTNDTISMCVDGVNVQVPVSSLSGILVPAASAFLAVGSYAYADLFNTLGGGASIGVAIGSSYALGPDPVFLGAPTGLRNSSGAGIGAIFTQTGTWRNHGGFETFVGSPDGTMRLWQRIA